MAVFDNYPYTNNHELNLDWIIKNTEKVLKSADEIAANTEIAQEAAENASQSELNAKASEDAAAASAEALRLSTEQIQENAENIEIQTARIDNLIDGASVDADAELLDIRVGADGITYPTAGDAVRGQFSTVYDGLTDIAELKTSYNLFDVASTDTLIGGYRNASNTIVSGQQFVCTNLIDVRNITKLYCKQFDTPNNVTWLQALRYAADGSFIERYTIPGGGAAGTANDYTVDTESFVRFNIQYASSQASQVPTLAQSFIITTYPINNYVKYESPKYVQDPVEIERIDANNINIKFGDASLLLFYTNNAGTNADNWNIGTVKLRDNIVVPAGTDILGPVLINDNADYIGGVHGDETTNNVALMIDGVYLKVSDVIGKFTGKKLTMLLDSNIYDNDDGNLAFKRVVQIVFEANKMTVSNTYIAQRALTLKRATNGGLIAAYSPNILSMAVNAAYINGGPTSAVNVASVDNTCATLNTKYGAITVRNIVGHEKTSYLGHIAVFDNETPIRTKIYFDTYKLGSYALASGAKIAGAFEYIFN